MSNDFSIENSLEQTARLETRLSQYKNIQEKLSKLNNISQDDKTDHEKAARGFESMILSFMIKEMKNGMLDKENKDGGGDMNFGADTLLDYSDMLLADFIAKSGSGIGIAKRIYEYLSNGEQLSDKGLNEL